ncbi:MAG: hypothetical protein ABI220_04995 [Candidatus Saccharimonadales bacterium]
MARDNRHSKTIDDNASKPVEPDSDIPDFIAGAVVTSGRGMGGRWLKRPSGLVLIIVAVIVVIGLIVGSIIIFRPSHPKQVVTPNTHKTIILDVPPPTAAQEHTIQYVRRIDGVITSASATGLTLQPSDVGSPPLNLTYTKDTVYSSGQTGSKAKQSNIVSGQKAVIGYDSSNNQVISVWADYDK